MFNIFIDQAAELWVWYARLSLVQQHYLWQRVSQLLAVSEPQLQCCTQTPGHWPYSCLSDMIQSISSSRINKNIWTNMKTLWEKHCLLILNKVDLLHNLNHETSQILIRQGSRVNKSRFTGVIQSLDSTSWEFCLTVADNINIMKSLFLFVRIV